MYNEKRGEEKSTIHVLLPVNVIMFVHSERAINYDTRRISFVSGYQLL